MTTVFVMLQFTRKIVVGVLPTSTTQNQNFESLNTGKHPPGSGRQLQNVSVQPYKHFFSFLFIYIHILCIWTLHTISVATYISKHCSFIFLPSITQLKIFLFRLLEIQFPRYGRETPNTRRTLISVHSMSQRLTFSVIRFDRLQSSISTPVRRVPSGMTCSRRAVAFCAISNELETRLCNRCAVVAYTVHTIGTVVYTPYRYTIIYA